MIRSFCRRFIDKVIKMQVDTTKRPASPSGTPEVETKVSKRLPYRKKKVAMLIVYNGADYQGLQINPNAKTIESDLLTALLKAGLIMPEAIYNPGVQISFQRAARTDKGVSAAGQLLSLKIFIDIDDPITKVNKHLVDAIRVIGIRRVTQGFNSKNRCDARTYQYLMPTYSFTPCELPVLENYRITDDVCEKIRKTLKRYVGTHNYHNFTSGKKYNEPSAKRYIIDFTMGEPFVKDGMEFVMLTVKGQSFMIHQIRKMIGFAIAIVRGLSNDSALDLAWKEEKVDVPIAPSLGLLLDKLHYEAYNKQFGNDGMHCKVEWKEYEETIEKFKSEKILSAIIATEIKEKSMITWMETLCMHTFDNRDSICGVREAYQRLREVRNAKKEKENKVNDTIECNKNEDSIKNEQTSNKVKEESGKEESNKNEDSIKNEQISNKVKEESGKEESNKNEDSKIQNIS